MFNEKQLALIYHSQWILGCDDDYIIALFHLALQSNDLKTCKVGLMRNVAMGYPCMERYRVTVKHPPLAFEV